MPVTERLMKAGDFQLQLAKGKGWSRAAYDACALFDHIVITPNRLHPIDGFSDANILAQAIYTGVIRKRPNQYTIVGNGLADWLGDDEGKGDLLDTAVTQASAATLSTWVTALRPSSLAAGTVTNTGTSYAGSYQYTTRREGLTHVCRSVGAEWRVNPNFTLDAAAPATLFVSTPTAVITRKQQSSEGSLRGVQAQEIIAANDVDSYTSKVIVVGKTGDGAAVAVGSATGSPVYKDGLNNDVVIERFIDAPQEPAASVTAYATAMLALLGAQRRPITIDTNLFAVPLTVKPGDYVWVYDPDTGTVDTANQIQWRGETVCPAKLRCQSTTWAIQKGMGVYARKSGSTATYYDLSDHVQYETGGSSFELGGGANDPLQDPSQLGSAFLGVNPDIVSRVGGGVAPPWTPAVTQGATPTQSVDRSNYYLAGRRCSGDASVSIGSGTTGTASNNVLVTVPLSIPASYASRTLGTGIVWDNSASVRYYFELRREGTTTCSLQRRNDGGALQRLGTSGLTDALANGDFIQYQFDYEPDL